MMLLMYCMFNTLTSSEKLWHLCLLFSVSTLERTLFAFCCFAIQSNWDISNPAYMNE